MEFFDRDHKFMVGQKNQTKYNTLYSLPISIIVPSNVAISSTSMNDFVTSLRELWTGWQETKSLMSFQTNWKDPLVIVNHISRGR